METEVVKIGAEQEMDQAIARAAQTIRAGRLVAFPTETVYGLGANALDGDAAKRIFEAKGRPHNDPLIVHLSSPAELPTVAQNISQRVWSIAEMFWPGPLTLILRKHPRVPDIVTAGLETVALRVPSHPIAHAIIRESGLPVGAPSANRFGHTSPTTAQHVLADLNGRVDLIVDAGPTPFGVESTVLDMTSDPPAVRRPGAVTLEALRGALGEVELVSPLLDDGQHETAKSPGTHSRHYAPNMPLFFMVGNRERALAAMERLADSYLKQGKQVGLLLLREDTLRFDEQTFTVRILGSETDYDGVARRLFSALRELEAAGVDLVLVRSLESTGLGLTINDRLTRAAAEIIDV